MMILITEEAIEKVKTFSEAEGVGHYKLRVKTIGGGCAGFRYDMYFEDDDPTDFDETFDHNGVIIICDSLSFQYLDGIEIGFKEEGIVAAGFTFNNPNVTKTCGCGSSFSV